MVYMRVHVCTMEYMRMDVRTTWGSLFSYSTSLWVQGSMQVVRLYGKYFNLLSYFTSTGLFFIFLNKTGLWFTELNFEKHLFTLCVSVCIVLCKFRSDDIYYSMYLCVEAHV